MVKFNIYAECDGDTDDDRELNGMTVVVRDGKVFFPWLTSLNSKSKSKLTQSRSTSQIQTPPSATRQLSRPWHSTSSTLNQRN
jgi:hypothetical protein